MEDPAYDSGVKSDSITAMFQSIVNVSKGKSPHILVPVPIDNIAPTTYIRFCSKTEHHPEPLRFQSKGSQSRRSQSYALSNGPISAPSIAEVAVEIPVEGSVHDDIMSTIDDFDTLSIMTDVVPDMPDIQDPEISSPVQEDTPEDNPIPLTIEPPRRRRRAIS
jgi:hypothetical protein